MTSANGEPTVQSERTAVPNQYVFENSLSVSACNSFSGVVSM